MDEGAGIWCGIYGRFDLDEVMKALCILKGCHHHMTLRVRSDLMQSLIYMCVHSFGCQILLPFPVFVGYLSI